MADFFAYMKDIRESFRIMDRDGNGLLSRKDLEALIYKIDPEMTEEEMSDLLDTADLDGKPINSDYTFNNRNKY